MDELKLNPYVAHSDCNTRFVTCPICGGDVESPFDSFPNQSEADDYAKAWCTNCNKFFCHNEEMHEHFFKPAETLPFITRTKAEWICHNAESEPPVDKLPSIPSLMQRIADSMCDNYCKYVEQYGYGGEESERMYAEHCCTCPINQLV